MAYLEKIRSFAAVFLVLTVYFGIKGLKTGISDPQDKQNHKARAIYYSVATLFGLVSFELYFPNIAILFCVPIMLIGIWADFLQRKMVRPALGSSPVKLDERSSWTNGALPRQTPSSRTQGTLA